MTRRAPLEVRLCGPAYGFKRAGVNFRRHILKKVDRLSGCESGVFLQIRQGVALSAEAVHQVEGGFMSAGFGPQLKNLPCDEIQECVAVFYRQKGLRTFQTHSGAKSTVELHDNQLLQQVFASERRSGNIIQSKKRGNAFKLRFRNQPSFTGDDAS